MIYPIDAQKGVSPQYSEPKHDLKRFIAYEAYAYCGNPSSRCVTSLGNKPGQGGRTGFSRPNSNLLTITHHRSICVLGGLNTAYLADDSGLSRHAFTFQSAHRRYSTALPQQEHAYNV